MNHTPLKSALGAVLICIGVAACTEQRTGREEAQAPYQTPEATTAPATDPAMDTGVAPTEPYATTPADEEIDAMTGSTDISGTRTVGDTRDDRCAGLTGQALTDCLEMESVRREETRTQDPELREDIPTP